MLLKILERFDNLTANEIVKKFWTRIKRKQN